MLLDAQSLSAERSAPIPVPSGIDTRPPAPSFRLADAHGLLGEWTALHEPHTEAPPAAVYAASLATCGALLGRGPSWHFGSTDHHARLFPLLIGPSGSGRKGTAIALGARVLLRHVDPSFADGRCVSGLSSGEGLIVEVRDAVDGGDPGVADKRLLVIEGEMASAFEAMGREGNRLSALVRDCWDGSDLRSMVKRDPQRATRPHVVIIGAITMAELRRLLKGSGLSNGLANRLLPIWCERARLLPEDSSPPPADVARIGRAIASALDTARGIGTVRWSPAAAQEWAATAYEQLAICEDASPTIRGLLERGAPYVRRIALTLALMDGSREVHPGHLAAALKLWQYAADTWRHVYHDGSAHTPLAGKLLGALAAAGSGGLTRTQIRERVVRSNDVPGERIVAALRELAGAGLAACAMDSTNGRHAERWVHARHVGGKGLKGANPPSPADPEGFSPLSPLSPAPVWCSPSPTDQEGLSPLSPLSPAPSVPTGRVRVTFFDGTQAELDADDRDLVEMPLLFRSVESL